jgi:myo-inositol-1(or 4)-monophosphatase
MARLSLEVEAEVARRAQVAIRAAEIAGDILRHMREGANRVERKGEVDFVSDADRASQDFVLGQLGEAFPTDALVAEEDHFDSPGASGFTWVVDPLDGTTNYLHGYAPWAVSIGLLFEGAPVFGVVHNVPNQEVYSAIRGLGAHCNGRRLEVSSVPRLDEALLASGFPYNRREVLDTLLARIRRALLVCQGFRRSGAASMDLCHVATGSLDGYWEQGLGPWDMAAGLVVVQEAGGVVTDFSGGAVDLFGGRVVASNGRFHDTLLRVLFDDPTVTSPV